MADKEYSDWQEYRYSDPFADPPQRQSASGAMINGVFVCQVLSWFADRMEHKLNVGSAKGKTGWVGVPFDVLFMRLLEEVEELREALVSGVWEDIIHESADVSNFAFFIAHNASLGIVRESRIK